MNMRRYGLHWTVVGDDIRLKVDHPDYDFVSVRVLYTLGGLDRLRGDNDVRGYYLSVLPIKGCRPNADDGLKILLKAVNKRSDKADALANAKGLGIMPMAVADVCGKIGASFHWADMKVVGGA